MSLSEVLSKALLSPYVIGAALFVIFYFLLVQEAASERVRKRKAAPGVKQRKGKGMPKEKSPLDKNVDTSGLGLE